MNRRQLLLTGIAAACAPKATMTGEGAIGAYHLSSSPTLHSTVSLFINGQYMGERPYAPTDFEWNFSIKPADLADEGPHELHWEFS